MAYSSLTQNICRLLIMTVQCFGVFLPHEAIYSLLYVAVTKGDKNSHYRAYIKFCEEESHLMRPVLINTFKSQAVNAGTADRSV